MIPSNFYPTDYTLSSQNLELTKTIPNISITTESFTDAYWLGWIYYDNLPTSYHVSSFVRDDDTGVCTWEDKTEVANYPVGYCGFSITSSGGINASRPVELTHNNGYWTASSSSNSYSSSTRLPNSLDINTTTWSTMLVVIYGEATDGNSVSQVFARIDADNQLLTGNYTVTVSPVYGSYTSRQVTINLDNFEDGTCEFAQGGYTYKLSIIGFEPVYLRDITPQGTAQYYVTPHPMVLIRDDRDRGHLIGVMATPYITRTTGMVFGGGEFFNGFYISVSRGNPYDGSYQDFYDNDYRFYGGMIGSYTLQDLNDNVSGTTRIFYPEESNFIIAGLGRSDVCALLRSYTIGDVRRTIALATRFSQSGTAVYQNSANELYAHVSEDNEFLAELIDGTHTDELRDWQLINHTIADNDFDPEDIPPYEPEPVDDGPDSGGDDSRPWDFVNTPLSATNNFVTLYALSTAQVSEFGAMMWAKLSDTAFWQSVGTVFLNDFSINPADMLKYFVSLRYFPFDLTNYSSSYANGIYIGRSTYPIQISTYPRRMTRNLVEISGGSAQVILPAPYDTQDFRNCDPNTQVTVYVPYCGIVELSAAEVYGKTLDLRYYADMQTGAMAASVCVRSDTYYEIATLAGSGGAEVPITANNNVEFLQRIATVASSGLGGTISGATNGAQIGGTLGAVAGGALGALTGSAQAMMALPQVSVHKSGKATGYATLGCDNQAHITIQASKPAVPDSFAHTNGYISNKQARIGDLSGYTEMINPDTSGIDAHADELEKIKAILQAGFYA